MSDSIKSLRYSYAFEDCKNLETVILPEELEELDGFSGCEKLNHVVIPAKVDHLSSTTFSGCINLTDLSVSADNETYSADEYGCIYNKDKTCLIVGAPAAADVVISDSVVYMESGAFRSSEKLQTVKLSSKLEIISSQAFSGCKNLKTVDLPKGIKIIDRGAFSNCSSLGEIQIPDSVIEIGYGAFSGCSSFKSVQVPDSVIEMKSSAFSRCEKLQSIELPSSIRVICPDTFSGCSSLKVIEFPPLTCAIAEGNLSELQETLIPPSVEFIGESRNSYWNKYNENLVIKGYTGSVVQQFASEHGFQFESIGICESYTDEQGIKYLLYEDEGYVSGVTDKGIEEVNIPETITYNDKSYCIKKIGFGAFKNCDNLTKVQFSKNIERIGCDAFFSCDSLKNVDIPETVKEIGIYAFQNIDDICLTFYNRNILFETAYVESSYEGSVTQYYSVTIRGYKDSTAEQYAKNNVLNEFVPLDEEKEEGQPSSNPAGTIAPILPTETPDGYEKQETANPIETSSPIPTQILDRTTNPISTEVPEGSVSSAPTVTPSLTPAGNTSEASTTNRVNADTGKKAANEQIDSIPAKVKYLKITNKKVGRTVISFKKVNGTEGYQIQFAKNKKFTKVKKSKITKKTTYTIKKLKKMTYYFRVRAYVRDSNGKKVYGKWSAVKKYKIKK